MAKLYRDNDGELSAYAWPGGYPIIYVTEDGGCLCPACANGKNNSKASETADTPSDWHIVGQDIHYEGPAEICDHCGTEIESAYGDPDSAVEV